MVFMAPPFCGMGPPKHRKNQSGRKGAAHGTGTQNGSQLGRGGELRRLHAGTGRGGDSLDHLGQHRVRLPRRRPGRDETHPFPGQAARHGPRGASGLPGSPGLREAQPGCHPGGDPGLRDLPDRGARSLCVRAGFEAPAREAPWRPVQHGRRKIRESGRLWRGSFPSWTGT